MGTIGAGNTMLFQAAQALYPFLVDLLALSGSVFLILTRSVGDQQYKFVPTTSQYCVLYASRVLSFALNADMECLSTGLLFSGVLRKGYLEFYGLRRTCTIVHPARDSSMSVTASTQ